MLKIKQIITASTEGWHHTWSNCDYATFFHSPEWSHIVKKYSDGVIEPVTKKILFNDDTSAFFILTATKGLKGFVDVYESAPLGVYGGWISTYSLTEQHSALIESYIIDNYPNLIWRINPFHPHNSYLKNHKKLKYDTSFAVSLKTSMDDLQKNIRRNTRRNINKANKLDLSIKMIEHQQVADYYNIYLQTLNRWVKKGEAKSHYRIEMFQQLFESDNCDFWGVFQDQLLICAGPILKSKNHVVTWLGLTHNDYLNKGINQFFYYHLIRYYKDQGFAWFDFNPSSNLKGVEHYKKGFPTTELPSPVLDSRSIILKVLQQSKIVFASNIKKLF